MPTKNISAIEQLNKLIAFGQIIYEEVQSQAQDAQTVDSLRSSAVLCRIEPVAGVSAAVVEPI